MPGVGISTGIIIGVRMFRSDCSGIWCEINRIS